MDSTAADRATGAGRTADMLGRGVFEIAVARTGEAYAES